jgi:hypothetical protein
MNWQQTFAALTYRNYRLLFIARLISQFAAPDAADHHPIPDDGVCDFDHCGATQIAFSMIGA